jgi:two-component system cell cycle sensor histidine kinase/response regulator CckA
MGVMRAVLPTISIMFFRGLSVDLILLDMVMPTGMNGRETYEAILGIRPRRKTVIASGYAKTEKVEEAQALGAVEFIQKPYTLEEIGLAVRRELGRE